MTVLLQTRFSHHIKRKTRESFHGSQCGKTIAIVGEGAYPRVPSIRARTGLGFLLFWVDPCLIRKKPCQLPCSNDPVFRFLRRERTVSLTVLKWILLGGRSGGETGFRLFPQISLGPGRLHGPLKRFWILRR